MAFSPSTLKLQSPAFANGAAIPARFTGEGEDVSPPLRWSDVSAEAKSLAIICHDPDAPLISPGGTYGFVHWVLYNIPASVSELAEATTEYTTGRSDFGKVGYGGPMPPNGHGPHHYYFWLLAMNETTQYEAGLTLWELLERAEPVVFAMNRLIGIYERR